MKTNEVNQITAAAISFAESLQSAVLSNETRDYLVFIGQIYDLEKVYSGLIARDYGRSQADRVIEPFLEKIIDLRTEVEKMLMIRITDNMMDAPKRGQAVEL